jgi:hypothetical protein
LQAPQEITTVLELSVHDVAYRGSFELAAITSSAVQRPEQQVTREGILRAATLDDAMYPERRLVVGRSEVLQSVVAILARDPR